MQHMQLMLPVRATTEGLWHSALRVAMLCGCWLHCAPTSATCKWHQPQAKTSTGVWHRYDPARRHTQTEMSAHLLNCVLQGLNCLVDEVPFLIVCEPGQRLCFCLLLLPAPRALGLLHPRSRRESDTVSQVLISC